MWESVRQRFSSCFANTKYEKQYVDADKAEHDSAFGRRSRELRDRAIQLHLDELEEKYLCCVCGAAGEARESDEHIYDTFSSVTLPAPEAVQAAMTSGGIDFDAAVDVTRPNNKERPNMAVRESVVEEVEPFEVEHLMYKIRHAVLKKEARTKRQAVAIHRDKGLLMIEEEEIETFSSFFRRPVKGYLCEACHTSAKTRLDMLTRQIETILFKATHPRLRKTSRHELQLLVASGQISQGLLEHVLGVRRTTLGTSQKKISLEGSPVSQEGSSTAKEMSSPVFPLHLASLCPAGMSLSLPDSCILSLRENVRCGVCENRSACFFVRSNVLFLCQFCCARDRYYRDNSICINDEPLSREDRHLLVSLARHFELVQQESVLRQLPQGHVHSASTSLFEVQQKETLFSRQDNLTLKHLDAVQDGAPSQRIALSTPEVYSVADQVEGSAVKLFYTPRPSLFSTFPSKEGAESPGSDSGTPPLASLFDGATTAAPHAASDWFASPLAL